MNALIIFYKNPIFGQVKTRLAATIGHNAAMDVYKKLVDHTIQISTPVNVQKVVFYSHYIEREDVWSTCATTKEVQEGADLGKRMQKAFNKTLLKKFEKVVMIGCDCIDLSSAIIIDAFEKLSAVDVVIGPALDGGYYLIGMKSLHSSLFENMVWSTDTVLKATLAKCRSANLTTFLLPLLSDIDTESDWAQWQESQKVQFLQR